MTKVKIYTGIGSRDVGQHTAAKLKTIATELAELGYVLRSGAADGCDQAFESGAGKKADIYLPWKGFNNSKSTLFDLPKSREAYDIAKSIHPAWGELTGGGRRMHIRNVFQVLGDDLDDPSQFLICWTRLGREMGGTRTALVLAKQHNIPIFNFGLQRVVDGYDKYGVKFFTGECNDSTICES